MDSLSGKEVLAALPPITVVAVVSVPLAIAAVLLGTGIALHALFTWMVTRHVERIRREEEEKWLREHQAAMEQARLSVWTLLTCCASLKSALLNEHGSTSPVVLEISRPFMTELLALEKVLHHLESLLEDGIVPERLKFFQDWYVHLHGRFEEALRPVALAPSIMEAIACDATAIWCDTIRFTLDTQKTTLLECLQHSQVQTQIAFAQAARSLAHKGSDARWKASGEYRTALIHWAGADAIRLVLRVRYEGTYDLGNPQVLAPYLAAFQAALAQKCRDDQITLAKALEVDKHTESGVLLTA